MRIFHTLAHALSLSYSLTHLDNLSICIDLFYTVFCNAFMYVFTVLKVFDIYYVFTAYKSFHSLHELCIYMFSPLNILLYS